MLPCHPSILVTLISDGERKTRQKEEDDAMSICIRGISPGEEGEIVCRNELARA